MDLERDLGMVAEECCEKARAFVNDHVKTKKFSEVEFILQKVHRIQSDEFSSRAPPVTNEFSSRDSPVTDEFSSKVCLPIFLMRISVLHQHWGHDLSWEELNA